VGILTDFFVAAEDEIDAGVVEDGPADRFPTVEAKSVDDVKITALNAIATGRSYEVDDGSFDRIYPETRLVRDGGEEGPWVIRFPAPLIDALAEADAARIAEINQAWTQTEEWTLEGVSDPEETRWIVDGIARLARDAQAAGKDVYLWLSL
jgi:hypothetical protein